MNRMALVVGVAWAALLALAATLDAADAIEPQQKILLFDGQGFEGWVRHLRDAQANVDETWTIKPEGTLACTGRPAGYIRTQQAYKNYKLHL